VPLRKATDQESVQPSSWIPQLRPRGWRHAARCNWSAANDRFSLLIVARWRTATGR